MQGVYCYSILYSCIYVILSRQNTIQSNFTWKKFPMNFHRPHLYNLNIWEMPINGHNIKNIHESIMIPKNIS